MEAYSRSFQDPRRAEGYEEKFRKGLFRRWTHGKELANLRAALARAGFPREGELVLDVPCGSGRWTEELSRGGSLYLGLDLSLPMVRILLARRGGAGRSAALASAWALPLRDGAAGVVVCWRLLHHVREEERKGALLGELCRVAGRALLVTFLDGASPKQRIHRFKRALLGRPSRRPAWTRTALEEEARKWGFAPAGYWPVSGWFSGQTLALFLRVGER